jgi:DNA polymerase-3 subunit beta
MKLVVGRSELSGMLTRLQGFLGKSNLSPILANVHIEADVEGMVTLSATDHEISFQGTLSAHVQESGAITVNGKRILAMTRQLPGAEIKLETNEQDELLLSAGKSNMTLVGIDAREFPEIQLAEQESGFTVRGGILTDLFERTLFSASTEEARANLNGVLFSSPSQGVIRVVSTDGHRLSLAERYAGIEGLPEFDAFEGQIIPRKAVVELRKLLDEYPDVSLTLSDQHLTVKTADFGINIRLIAERFPPYEAVIPKSNNDHYVFDRQALLGALKRMGLVGEEKLHGVELTFNGGEVLLESRNNSLGQVNETLPLLEGSSETALHVSFGVHYMIDVLNVIKGSEVHLYLNQNEARPGLFKDPEFDQDLFVVMPKRT